MLILSTELLQKSVITKNVYHDDNYILMKMTELIEFDEKNNILIFF